MASPHHDAPEVAPQNFPEVIQAPQFQYQPSQYQYAQPPPGTPIKSPDSSYAATGYASVPEAVTYLSHPSGVDAQPATHQEQAMEKGGRKRVVCGCSLIVFILSCIIGVLAAAVIGLAAGTGVEANRAATAEAQVEELKSSLAATATTTSASPTATATWDNITNNCSSKADSVTSTTYTTQFFDQVTFTMYCNRDTPIGPILSLFVADFNTCMDACAAYTSYTNTTCAAVSFAPAWSNKTKAIAGSAPGDCYLKPGPQNRTALTSVNAGTEVHSAILLIDD